MESLSLSSSPPSLSSLPAQKRLKYTLEVSSPLSSKWEWTPLSILSLSLNMLDPESLMETSTVSKQFHKLIIDQGHGMNNEIVPVIEIGASENVKDDKGRAERLIRNLHRNLEKLQRYRVIKIKDVLKFRKMDWNKTIGMTNNMRFDGTVSLDISSSTPTGYIHACSFPTALTFSLPNLRDIDISNMSMSYSILKIVGNNCPGLRKVKWNNIQECCCVSITGEDMFSANRLKEIYMDDGQFFCLLGALDIRRNLSDLNSTNNEDDDDDDDNDDLNIFIFHNCVGGDKNLEKVSIRNARYIGNGDRGILIDEIIPQNALIKFIRNAPPSFRWFRSNLSQENIDMLKKERPEIEFSS